MEAILIKEMKRDPQEFVVEYLAGMPSFEIPQIPREATREEIREINRRLLPGYDRVRERVLRALYGRV